MYSTATDGGLHDWLTWAEEKGSSLPRGIAEAALVADSRATTCFGPSCSGRG